MRYAFAQVAFGLGANALVARESSQCIQLQASGGASGVLGQLGDGQNRVGGGYASGCYCLGSNGGFIDSNGRGCILTPPTTQFQCDVGASPTTGFAIGSGGGVTYNGNEKFYACPATDSGEFNVYTQPAPGQKKCVEISLSSAGSCRSGNGGPATGPAPKPSQSAQQSQPEYPASQPTPQPSMPALQPPNNNTGACPADLNGSYEYPHLIVPVDSENTSKAYGTSYNGKVDAHMCSIFNFDIPTSYSGKTCSLVFLFPIQKDLETSSYTTSGSGKVVFSRLEGPASEDTTYATQPSKMSMGSYSVSVAPGNSYTIHSGACDAGQTFSYAMCGEGDFAMEYFQDYNPSPIGLYIRSC
ncbi:hypothetical protein EJ02DRAFT_345705 [Clathrospora elynae]|uniref:Uncharacterized protein n=1 Tax=Clathrospora elynae TaxID=706981 RepID=A0A6A5SQK2_9PLEO|nr:hypothetical protein EJ02DRAFT_345705 [Clathrospora elynae]